MATLHLTTGAALATSWEYGVFSYTESAPLPGTATRTPHRSYSWSQSKWLLVEGNFDQLFLQVTGGGRNRNVAESAFIALFNHLGCQGWEPISTVTRDNASFTTRANAELTTDSLVRRPVRP